jgi:hypothetical protein
MNIFYLDTSPVQAAQWMVDRHVVKMILESCQLLSTAHRVLDGTKHTVVVPPNCKKSVYQLDSYLDSVLYQATHINHPSSVWCRQSTANYQWLHSHLGALLKEYTYRYGKTHGCHSKYEALSVEPLNIPSGPFTQPTPAMDEQFVVSDDSVVNYRNYYKCGKAHLHSWTNRNKPFWL